GLPIPARELRQTEIEDLHPPVLRHEKVLGLQIPVHDPALVGGGETECDLRGVVDTLPDWERRAANALAQGLPFQQFEAHVRRPLGRSEVVDRQNVRMVQRADGARLLLEALQTVGVGPDVGRKDLDRNLPSQARIESAVDLPHSAGSDGILDAVGTELRAALESHESEDTRPQSWGM